MSNKKKNKKNANRNDKAEKYLSYGTIIGLVIGVIIAFILLVITDNMLWMVLPIITLFVGLGISSFIANKDKNKPSTNKSK